MQHTGTCLYLVPAGTPRNCLRAALMAMNVLPREVTADMAGLKGLRDAMVRDARAVAVIDLAALRSVLPHLLALKAFLVDSSLSCRVTLLRSSDGPVWASDRQWVKGLGFADLLTDLDPVGLAAAPMPLLAQIATGTGAPLIEANALTRYFSAMQVRVDSESARGQIRALTGLSAEVLASLLASSVKALDRVHNITTYSVCFVGTEAVAWFAAHFRLNRAKAVSLGRALHSLRLIGHVVHEHGFEDADYFYRVAVSTAVDRLHLGAVLQAMRSAGGVEIKNRSYRLRSYPSCFVGSEAVEWLHARHRIARHDAETFLNRLQGYGLVRHVKDAHLVRDGEFFYHFID